MSWQNNNGRGGRPGNSAPPDLGVLIQQGQDKFKQMVPGGNSRGRTGLVIVILLGIAAWTAYYTVPSDSVAVIQRFGKYLKEVPPGSAFQTAIRCGRSICRSGQTAIKAGIRLCHPGCPGPFPDIP